MLSVLVACGGNDTPCTNHTDANGDGVCDTEGCNETVTPTPPSCTEHKDADGDGVCDTEGCGEAVAPVCTEHKDADGDGVCDTEGCNEPVAPVCTEHKDADGDGVCDTEGCGEAVEPEAPDYFNEDGELILYKDGKPTFQFVLGTSLFTSSSAVGSLQEKLTRLSAEPIVLGTTGTGDSGTVPQPVEILFGIVNNRGDEYAIDIHSLGLNGYVVKQVGTKILVLGGSADSMKIAVEHLEKNVFGIKKANDPFTDLVMESELNVHYVQDDYKVTGVSIGTEPINGYLITYSNGDTLSKKIAEDFRDKLYANTGIWLDVKRADKADENARTFHIALIDNDGEGGGFYFNIDKTSGNATLECEYSTLFKSQAEGFFHERIFADGIRGKVTLSDFNPNYRDIYYSAFGAVGDGVTDDFFALKAAHNVANAELLNVHADSDAVYYIGAENGYETVTVKTNTYWHGCTFIFDDEDVHYGAERNTSIFTFAPDNPSVTFRESNGDLPITSLKRGQQNIGWAPGATVMLIMYNDAVKHYIRFGANENSGDPQHELIIVDAEGNVDPTTPIQWDYDRFSKIVMYNVDDTPIEVVGYGDNGEKTKIITRYNDGPNAYLYYARNLYITRSNITIKGIDHSFAADSWTPYEEGGKGCPYGGFTKVQYCSNVALDDFIIECPETYYSKDVVPGLAENPNGTNMGSYEMSANEANNVRYSNFVQSNFFDPDGTKKFDGCMGTNFCKNLSFDNMYTCSFDAHCGVYNAYIRNSTVDHLNFIGDGEIIIENTVIYSGGVGCVNAALNLRYDYGATWQGSVYIDGLTFKYPTNHISLTYNPLSIVNATFSNHFFGYTCYLPQSFVLKNVRTEEYSFELVGEGNGNTNRVEHHVSYNSMPVDLFSSDFQTGNKDYSHESFGSYGSNAEVNLNPTVPTKTVVLFTEYTGDYADTNKPLVFNYPTSKTMKDTNYYTVSEGEWTEALNVGATNLAMTQEDKDADGNTTGTTTIRISDTKKHFICTDSINTTEMYLTVEESTYYSYVKLGNEWIMGEANKSDYDSVTPCFDYNTMFSFSDFTFDTESLTYKCDELTADGTTLTDVELTVYNGRLHALSYTDAETGYSHTVTYSYSDQTINIPSV